MDDLEAAALSGDLFRPRSSDPGPSNPAPPRDGPSTGPKGVIEDRRAHDRRVWLERDRMTREVREDQEKRKMVALTSEEEDERRERERLMRESGEDEGEVARWRRKRREEIHRETMNGHGDRSVKRGGLREVGKEGFVGAVERPGWVVVLIHEPDVQRCQDILTSLLHLSLALQSSLSTPLSLLRARASNLDFSLLPDGEPDLDVLPTMLAYKDGELERTWIRVDWEVSEDGVEGLLRREGLLPPRDGLEFGVLSFTDGSDDDE